MANCYFCGSEFDVSYVRQVIGIRYGAGTYDEYYPDGDVCLDCATGEIGADHAAGEEIIELMGPSFDWD